MQIKAFSWKAYSLLSIIASCSPDFHTHSPQEEASDKYTEERIEQSRKLKSRYEARNRFQEPSMELNSQAT
jgi:hypothetical protein